MSAPSSKRQSTAPAAPKPPVNFSSSLTIPRDAALIGTHSITVQAETLIHPRAILNSTYGSILIGRRCVVHERANLGAQPESPETAKSGGLAMGDYVVIETSSIIEAGGTEIGEGTVVEVGCRIGSGARIGKDCTICSRSKIAAGEVIPDRTVIYSNGKRRIDRRRIIETRKIGLVKQINVSKAMIKNDPDKFK